MLVVVCFAQFMVVLDATIVNVALPSIESGLSLSASNLQWVINAYSLTLGGFLLLGGRAGDILGRKRLFMAGLVLFSAASLANGVATSSLVLIIGRAVQGVGGALIVPAVLSIITTNFTTALEREKALAVWSAISATGGAVGLLLGGVLTSALSWRWIFLVNVPVGLLVLLATIRIVPESRAPDSKRAFDAAGATLVTAGLGVSVFAIVKSETYGWSSGLTWALLVGGLALIAAFLALERRSSAPLMRLGIFHTPGLGPASVIQVLTSGAAIATFFFVSLYLQQVLGFRPFSGGLALLPISAGIVGRRNDCPQSRPEVRSSRRRSCRHCHRLHRPARSIASSSRRSLRVERACWRVAVEPWPWSDVPSDHPNRHEPRRSARRRLGVGHPQHRAANGGDGRIGRSLNCRRQPRTSRGSRRPHPSNRRLSPCLRRRRSLPWCGVANHGSRAQIGARRRHARRGAPQQGSIGRGLRAASSGCNSLIVI